MFPFLTFIYTVCMTIVLSNKEWEAIKSFYDIKNESDWVCWLFRGWNEAWNFMKMNKKFLILSARLIFMYDFLLLMKINFMSDSWDFWFEFDLIFFSIMFGMILDTYVSQMNVYRIFEVTILFDEISLLDYYFLDGRIYRERFCDWLFIISIVSWVLWAHLYMYNTVCTDWDIGLRWESKPLLQKR